MKGAILFSTTNPASMNILRHLQQDWKWKPATEKERGSSDAAYAFSTCAKENCCSSFLAYGSDKSIIDIVPPPEALDSASRQQAGYFLYASTHKSEAGLPALTVHLPGNWGASADLGGAPRTLNMAYAAKMKQLMLLLAESSRKHGLSWPIALEVDHHGPTGPFPAAGSGARPAHASPPLIFVEIGSGPEQWENEAAGKAVAEAMMKALFRPAPLVKAHLGIGGTHYGPKFSPYMLTSPDGAVGHVVPKYHADSFDEAMLSQALEKSVEKVEGALIDWKGLSGTQRERIIPMLEKAGVKWEKI